MGRLDLKVTNFNWQTSWFGNFYLSTNSPLINAGSSTADQIGLYQFTTQTNQLKEQNTVVDIGYHYVATDNNGNPWDSNGDGTPDYIEDANGNGLVDIGEIPWIGGTNYFVATNGSDLNPGTLTAPFQHIQTAANQMQPGDFCIIRGGTYRETVRTVVSGTATEPLTFMPYLNETVTISGCDVVTGWQTYSNSIMVVTNTAPITQLFVDGRQMNAARFPNINLGDPLLSTMDWTNVSSYEDINGVNWATISGADPSQWILGGMPDCRNLRPCK